MTNNAFKARSSDTRSRLLKIAEQIFLDEGIAAITLRAVAKEAGLTPMAIYRHFEDKQALIAALLGRGFDYYADYLDIQPVKSELKHFEALAARVFDFAVEKGAFFELMFLTSRSITGIADLNVIRAAQEPTYNVARNAIKACRDANSLQVDNLRHMTNDVLAWCIGFSAFYLSGSLAVDAETARRQFRSGFKRLIEPYRIA